MKATKIIHLGLAVSMLFFAVITPLEAAITQIDARFIKNATLDLTTKVSNTLPAINGGSGINAYNAGDTLYSSATNTLSKLSGNTTTTPKMLMQTGNGTISNAPTWTQPTLNNILAPTTAFDFGTQNITGVNNISAGNANITGLGGVLRSSSTITKTVLATGLNFPNGACIDSVGNLYIADTNNNAIKKMDTSGVVTTLVSGLSLPKFVIVDSSGNLYFTESTNLKKRDTSGTITTLITGLITPKGIVMDSLGNLYVTSTTIVKKYDTTAVTTSFITGLGNAYSLGVDSSNNIYVLDAGTTIKKYNSTGTFLNNISGYAGTSYSIAVDSLGNIYYSDTTIVNYIKKIDTKGILSTFNRNFLSSNVLGITISPDAKTLYISDSSNGSIKSIDLQGSIIGGAVLNDLGLPTDDVYFNNKNINGASSVTCVSLSASAGVYGLNFIASANTSTQSFTTAFLTKTTAYSILATDFTVNCDTTTASFSATLPTAISKAGQIYVIKKKVAINTLTIATSLSQTIDGATTQALTAQYSSLMLQSDGANWIILSRI